MTVQEVFSEIEKRLAPARIASLQTNADYIALYLKKSGLEFNVDNAVAAINALHAQGRILWEVDPVEVSPAELLRIQKQKDKERAAAEDAKFKPGVRHVDDVRADNATAADKAKQDAEAKALAQTKSEITREITSYVKGHHSGNVNYAATESGQAKLQEVAGNYLQLTNLADAKRVLQDVRSVKQQLS